MILPIVAYGDPVLRKKTEEVELEEVELKELIDNMFETMYNAPGVGLAAPQIGESLRLFVVDSEQLFKEQEENKNGNGEGKDEVKFTGEPIKQAFINPQMIKEYGKKWIYEEGCLSIPGIREDVQRDDTIIIRYFDQAYKQHEKEFTGITARIIQHEYDHIEGVLFTDRIKPLKRQMLRNRLGAISKGEVEVAYKMLFPAKKKAR